MNGLISKIVFILIISLPIFGFMYAINTAKHLSQATSIDKRTMLYSINSNSLQHSNIYLSDTC